MINDFINTISNIFRSVVEFLQSITFRINEMLQMIPIEAQLAFVLVSFVFLYYYYTTYILSNEEVEMEFISKHGEKKFSELMTNYLTPMINSMISYISSIRNILFSLSFVFQTLYNLFIDSFTMIEIVTVIFACINASVYITIVYYLVLDILIHNIKESNVLNREDNPDSEMNYRIALMRSVILKSTTYIGLALILINAMMAFQVFGLSNISDISAINITLLTRLSSTFIVIGSLVGCVYTKLFDIGLDTAEDINESSINNISKNSITVCELIGDMVGDATVINFAMTSLSWFVLNMRSGITPNRFAEINPLYFILPSLTTVYRFMFMVYVAVEFTTPFEYIYNLFNIKLTQRVELFSILISYLCQSKIYSVLTNGNEPLEQSLLSTIIYILVIYGYSFDYPFNPNGNLLLKYLSELVVKGGSSINLAVIYASFASVINIILMSFISIDLNLFKMLACFDILAVAWDIRNASCMKVIEETKDQSKSSDVEDQIGNAVKMSTRLFVLTSLYKTIVSTGELPSFNTFGLVVFLFNLFSLTYFFYSQCDQFVSHISKENINTKSLMLNVQTSSFYCLSTFVLTIFSNIICNTFFGIDIWQSMKGLSTGIYFLAMIVSTMGSLFDQLKKYIKVSDIKEENKQAWINVTYLDTAGDYLKDTLSPFLVYTLLMLCIH